MLADRLQSPPWIAAGIPETAGHPWWLIWARSATEGERKAEVELEQRRKIFAGGTG